MQVIDAIERIIQLLGIDKTGSFYVIYIILFIFALGWILPKSKEVGAWKDLFSKDKAKKIEQARDLLKNFEQEADFYEETMRQEIFHQLMGIRCRKEYREIYQNLVTESMASVEEIRLAYTFICNENSKVEIKFTFCDNIELCYLLFMLFVGIVGIPLNLVNLIYNFDLSKFPNSLFGLSVTTMVFFISLRGVLPRISAENIQKRLKKIEENNEHTVSPSEQIDTTCEQNTAIFNGEL